MSKGLIFFFEIGQSNDAQASQKKKELTVWSPHDYITMLIVCVFIFFSQQFKIRIIELGGTIW